MPIYEYECDACGHRFETLQKMSDDPLKDCPQCQKPELRKLMSAAAFKLKGQGWYESDFKNPQNTNKAASSSGDSGGGKTSSGGAQKSSDSATGGSSDSGGASKSGGDSASSGSKTDSAK